MDRQLSDEPVDDESGRTKKPKKLSRDDCIKEILKLQKQLLKDHKTACLFAIQTKYGQMQFGSNNVLEKFRSYFRNDSAWGEAFEDDDEELIQRIQIPQVDEDEYDLARANLLPKKLPADLNLMNYEELWTYIRYETLKEHWAKGGKYKCVKWGNPDFEPTFWLGEIWPWAEVNDHPNNLAKSAYSGPGTMSNFLKKVIKNIVEGFGINHKEWIDPKFTDEKRKRRERARKKSTPSDIERQEDDDDLTDYEQQTDLNNSNMEADHNDSGTDRQGSVANDLILEETFTQEIEIDGSNPGVDETMKRQGSSDTKVSNISDLLHNNGIDLGNMDNSQGFATSTLRGQPGRCSARQAAKRARLHSVPRPPIPPRPVSPLLEEPSTSTSAPLPPSPPRPAFVPRRRPLGNGRGCSNFRSPLNVNVGQEFSSDNTILELHIPSDLVSEFGKLSKTNRVMFTKRTHSYLFTKRTSFI